ALGATPTTRASVRLSAAYGDPYWVLFGIQRLGRAPDMIPVLYPESVELRVPRDEYDLSALFMMKPHSFGDKPVLVAVGHGHAIAISAYVQQVTVWGSRPSQEQIARLISKFPRDKLPFHLPPAELFVGSSGQHLQQVRGRLLPGYGRPAIGAPAAS